MPPSNLITTDSATILPENPPPSTSIYVLANEILIEIFKKGAEAWALSKNAQSTVPFPILVSGVCSHWRAVALDAPELWKTIYLPLNLEIASTWDPYIWVSTWIRRAKTIPVTVVLDIPADPPHFEEICLSQVIPFILKASPAVSVRRLDIHYQQEQLASVLGEVILQTFQASFDQQHCLTFEQLSLCFSGISFRKSVTLTDSNCPWGQSVVDPMPVFCVSKLRLQGIVVNPLQFPNLTSLTIFNLVATYKDIQVLFATSPNLTHLTLRGFSIPRSSLTVGNICLQSLQTLAIRFNTTRPNSAYPLSYLHLPNLKYLELDGNLELSVSQVLCESLLANQLEILALSNFEHSFRSPTTSSYTFHSVKHIRLINVRLSECMSPSPTSMSVQTSLLNWPALQTLATNATLARDVIDLLNFPHPHIQTVYLTPAAQHHLTHNTGRNGHHLTRNTEGNGGKGTFYLKFPLVSERHMCCSDVKKRDEANIAASSYNKRFNIEDFDPTIHSCLLEDPEEPGFLNEMI
ncbi:hypothetical protein K443DRAFT_172023 [Laccaria amethystina LaAM-08-1]|uniref:F-box domain-containing protein n=1 Tax=Laccaria amethystina LaAM-08-1 TaxID=1095629 RepID=A0A0C9XDC4_9AGAR|nr:hypothetical protein K443DRAFT_172023 [Laccaria amethystina LaAM-08-1]